MSLSRFERCLQEVRNNDVNRTEVMHRDISGVAGYGRRLGEALLQNTNVTKVIFRLNERYSIASHDAPLSLSDDETKQLVANDLSPLLEYLQSSSTLQTVRMVDSGRETLVSQPLVLTAIANNPNPLHVEFWGVSQPDIVAEFVQQSQNLVHLAFWGIGQDVTLIRSLVETVGAKHSLVKLDWNNIHKDHLESVDSLLQLLETHPNLEHLVLHFFDVDTLPLNIGTLVQSNRTKLQRLELRSVRPAMCVDLLSLPTRVLRSFKFQGTEFCTGSADGCFDALLQAKSASAERTDLSIEEWESQQGLSSLFDVPLHSQFRIRELNFTNSAHANVRVPSIALFLPLSLHLHCLRINWNIDFDMPISADMVVQMIRSHNVPERTAHAATGLTVGQLLLQGIRGNGSLLKLDYGRVSGIATVAPPAVQRKISAYLDRNRKLPKLMARLGRIEPNSDESALCSMLLAPLLFKAASPATKMAPTHILSGLLAMGLELEGAPSRGKRISGVKTGTMTQANMTSASCPIDPPAFLDEIDSAY